MNTKPCFPTTSPRPVDLRLNKSPEPGPDSLTHTVWDDTPFVARNRSFIISPPPEAYFVCYPFTLKSIDIRWLPSESSVQTLGLTKRTLGSPTSEVAVTATLSAALTPRMGTPSTTTSMATCARSQPSNEEAEGIGSASVLTQNPRPQGDASLNLKTSRGRVQTCNDENVTGETIQELWESGGADGCRVYRDHGRNSRAARES